MANQEPAAEDRRSGEMSTENPAAALQRSSAGDQRPGAPPCPIPSFADACSLVDAPYSCLVVEIHRRHVALSPLYLRRKRTGIREQLDAELLKYSESLEGVPLAYDDVKVIGQHGDIYDDNAFVHMDIESTFVIFRPERGQSLTGVVNKVGVTHVGCVVHGCFNASVPRPPQVSQEAWQRAGPRVGSALSFLVSQLDADNAGVLLIRGRLSKHSAQALAEVGVASGAELTEDPPLEETGEKEKNHQHRAGDVSTAMDETAVCEAVAVETVAVEMGMASVDGDVNGNCKKKKKKKKKKREEEEEEEQLPNSPVEVLISDSSGYHSDKGSRKRKKREEQEAELGSSLLEGSEPKKKKQKKDKRSSQ